MFRKLHEPTATITLYVEDVPVSAEPGETVAAVLLRQPEIWTHRSPVSGAARAPFCMMGVCFDCLAEVDEGGPTQTCQTLVRPGMRIRRLRGRRDFSA